MTEDNKYIPALRFHWLTNIYDWLISNFMPEKKFKQALIKNINIQPNDKILDFGIGTATLSLMAYNQHTNSDFTGIDIDKKILAIALQKISKVNANIKLIQYGGGRLPFDDNSIDNIMSSLVIHHLTTEQKTTAFKEFIRVLKPNGKLHIADWGKANNVLMRLCFHIVQLLDGYKTTTDNVKGRLPQLLLKAGFSKVDITHSYNSILGTIEIFKIKK
jgi:ubiquinone/menaquinone biosynthesis C-methylase UbiE